MATGTERPIGQTVARKFGAVAARLVRVEPAKWMDQAMIDEAVMALREAETLAIALEERVRLAADDARDLRRMMAERNEARAHARVLAFAFRDDARPPASVVRASLAYDVDQR